MKKEYEFCDICGKQLVGRKGRDGVVVCLGYSRKGWGRRCNAMNWTGEVCKDCFEKFEEASNSFAGAVGLKADGKRLKFSDRVEEIREMLDAKNRYCYNYPITRR